MPFCNSIQKKILKYPLAFLIDIYLYDRMLKRSLSDRPEYWYFSTVSRSNNNLKIFYKMKKTIYILCISLMLAGCASLTKTQIVAVNQFAQTSKDFSAYPSKIMTELADVRLKRGIFYANLFNDKPSKYISVLDSAFNEKKQDYQLSEKVDVTFKIIDKYAQSLLLLSSDQYTTDLKEQTETFGVDLDSLITLYNSMDNEKKIPSGIGGLVSQIIYWGGDIYIKNKQGKNLKSFIPKADTLIGMMITNLKEFLVGKVYIPAINDSLNIQDLIKNEETGIRESYKFYVSSCSRLNTLPTLESENEYLNTLKVLDGVNTLLEQTVSATDGLRKAHHALLKAIEKKKTLTESIKELQSYYDEIRKIKTTIEKIEKVKK